jgi:hypothetical protein
MVTGRRPVRRAPSTTGDIRPCRAWPRSGILGVPPRALGRERVTIGAWGRASTIPAAGYATAAWLLRQDPQLFGR